LLFYTDVAISQPKIKILKITIKTADIHTQIIWVKFSKQMGCLQFKQIIKCI